jgi:sugar phosphate isomerase/epimerase
MHALSLEPLTIDDAAPMELIAIAAQLGCRYTSFILRPAQRPPVWFDLVTSQALRRDLRWRTDDCDVAAYTVDFLALSPRVRAQDYAPAFECAADLGARCFSVLVSDADEQRRLENFCEACELAQSYGLHMNLEFVAFMAMPSLKDAVRLLQRAAQPNAGVVLDILHFVRSGGVIAELQTLDPKLIGAVQLSDGPKAPPPDQLHEAVSERMLPGQGEFPLREFVAGIPETLPIGVEVPLKSLRERGLSATERARRAVEATREVLARM